MTGGAEPLWAAISLLVSDISDGGFFSFVYADCAYYDPAQCPGEVQLQENETCNSHLFLNLGLPPRISRKRGVLSHRPVHPDQADEIYTGGVEIRVFTDRARDLDDVVAQLQPVKSRHGARGRLPRAALPAYLWRSLRRTRATVRQLGSVSAAARRLRKSPLTFRQRLAVLRKLRSIGHVGTLHCRSIQRRRG